MIAALVENDFKKAFRIARTNRLDMNLLHDDCPNRFFSYAEKFIEQVGYQNHRDGFHVFIADIRNYDARQSDIYKNSYINPSKIDTTDKINRICEKFMNITSDLSVFIACCIRSQPKQILAALLKIKSLLESPETIEIAEKGINQIFVILDDKHKLYREALGTYDKSVFLMIAERAQEDPSEYLQLLKEFDECQPEAYRKASIDIYLKRYSSAIENLAECTEEERLGQAIELARSNELFPLLIVCYKRNGNTDFHVKACISYANDLEEKGNLSKAGLYYGQANNYEKAAMCFEKSGNYEHCVKYLKLQKLTADDFNTKCEKLGRSLSGRGRHGQAFEVFNFYTSNKNRAEEELIKACRSSQLPWAKVSLIQNSEILLESIADYTTSTELTIKTETENLEILSTRFKNLVQTRLEEIRNRHGQLVPDEIFMPGGFADGMSLDSASVSQSSSSKSSKTSGKTSKARRKASKKKYNSKPGSRSEHLGLLTEIHTKFKQIEAMIKEVPAFINSTQIYVQDGIPSLISTCKNSIQRLDLLIFEIWPHANKDDDLEDKDYFRLLKTFIDTGIEVKKLEKNYQREIGHRLGGLFIDLQSDLHLMVPYSLTVSFNDFNI